MSGALFLAAAALAALLMRPRRRKQPRRRRVPGYVPALVGVVGFVGAISLSPPTERRRKATPPQGVAPLPDAGTDGGSVCGPQGCLAAPEQPQFAGQALAVDHVEE